MFAKVWSQPSIYIRQIFYFALLGLCLFLTNESELLVTDRSYPRPVNIYTSMRHIALVEGQLRQSLPSADTMNRHSIKTNQAQLL